MAEEYVWLAAGLVTFAVGLAAGAWMSRSDRGTKRRVAELETQVEQIEIKRVAEREAVAKHFDQTSDLFRDLTRNYTALYAHLAEGARDLCPERTPEIGRGLGELPGLTAGPPGIGSSEFASEMETETETAETESTEAPTAAA